MVKKTRRSNEPFKRHHWKSARTERRNRFAHGLKLLRATGAAWGVAAPDFEPEDRDLAFRRRGGWLTADKSHVRWAAARHRIDMAHPQNPLLKRLRLRNA